MPVEGVVATLAAVSVIATLMVIGIRMKLPPPDPDWREHIPPPPPPPPSWWQAVWLSRFGVLLVAIALSIPEQTRPFGGALFAIYIAATMALAIDSIRRAVKYRRALKARADEPET